MWLGVNGCGSLGSLEEYPSGLLLMRYSTSAKIVDISFQGRDWEPTVAFKACFICWLGSRKFHPGEDCGVWWKSNEFCGEQRSLQFDFFLLVLASLTLSRFQQMTCHCLRLYRVGPTMVCCKMPQGMHKWWSGKILHNLQMNGTNSCTGKQCSPGFLCSISSSLQVEGAKKINTSHRKGRRKWFQPLRWQIGH